MRKIQQGHNTKLAVSNRKWDSSKKIGKEETEGIVNKYGMELPFSFMFLFCKIRIDYKTSGNSMFFVLLNPLPSEIATTTTTAAKKDSPSLCITCEWVFSISNRTLIVKMAI
jgi:hypothetical protein